MGSPDLDSNRPMPVASRLTLPVAVAVASFVTYAFTACRTITWWDGTSYPLAAYTLGIAPAPGSLLLTLLGWIWTRIPLAHPVAFQLNLLAALIAATLAGLVTWIGIDLATREGSPAGVLEAFAGAIAGLTFAFALTPWNYAVQFTPYVLSACFAALILLAALGWWRHAKDSDSPRRLFLLLLLLGLDFSVHRTNSLMLPAALVWVTLRRPRAWLRASAWGAAGAGLVLGLALQLLLIPLAARDPAFNMEDPRSLARLWSYVSIGDKGGGFLIGLFPRRADFFHVQLADYLGFLWRNLSSPLPGPLGYLPALVTLLGWSVALKTAGRRSLGLLVFFLCAGLGAVLYFNLPGHYFRTLDRHYLPSLVVLAPFMAVGTAALLRFAAHAPGFARPALVLGLGGILLTAPIRSWTTNWRKCDLSRVRYTETFGRDLLEPLPYNSILLTNGDNDTFPLWYLQEVEGARRDVTIVNIPLANTGWWVDELRRRDTRYARLLDDERKPGVLKPIAPQGSTRTVAVAPDAPLGLPGGARRPVAVSFSISGTLFGEDRVVLELLRIERWRRPLYLACTVSDNHLSWLWPYARLDGLAYRVVPSSDSTAWDLDHARHQLTEKMTYAGLADTTAVMDQYSRAICGNYVNALRLIASAQLERGDPQGCLVTLRFLEEHVAVKRLGFEGDPIGSLRARANGMVEGRSP
jgi:hypothetical protein